MASKEMAWGGTGFTHFPIAKQIPTSSNTMRHYLCYKVILLCVLLFGIVFSARDAPILVLDLGTDTLKASAVSPNKRPFFQVLLNEHTQRKTVSKIGFHSGHRYIGDDANSVVNKEGAQVYSSLTLQLGQSENALPQLIAQQNNINNANFTRTGYRGINFKKNTKSGYIEFENNDWGDFTSIELISTLFSYTKKLAQQQTQAQITQAVLIVPPFLSMGQRSLLLSSAQLSGLDVLAVINDNVAVCLSYGIEFEWPETIIEAEHTVLVVDAGHSTTKATVCRFEKNLETGVLVSVKVFGGSWDFDLSATEIDRYLAQHIMNEIIKKQYTNKPEELLRNSKLIEKLFREAKKAKHVLSANKQATVVIENIVGDNDFNLVISRDTFEQLNDPLFQKLPSLVQTALQHAEITMGGVHSIEIVGGSSRIPKFQQILKSLCAHCKDLGTHINADEGILVGGSYYAGYLSGAVGNFNENTIMKHLIKPPIQIVLSHTDDKAVSFPSILWTDSVNSTLLPATERDITVTATLKLSAAQIQNSITISIQHKPEPFTELFAGISPVILQVSFVDIIEQLKQISSTTDIVSIKMNMRIHGDAEQITDINAALITNDGAEHELKVVAKNPYVLTSEEITISKHRIRNIDEHEQSVQELFKLKSELESLLFNLNEKLTSDVLEKYATTEEARSLEQAISDAQKVLEEELQEEGHASQAQTMNENNLKLNTQYQSLLNLSNKILNRIQSHKKLQERYNSAKEFINKLKKDLTKLPKETAQTEVKKIEKMTEELETWLHESMAKQSTLPLSSDLVITPNDIQSRVSKIESALKQLSGTHTSKTKQTGWLTVQVKLVLVVIGIVVGIVAFIFLFNYQSIFANTVRKLTAKQLKREKMKGKRV